MMWLCVFRNPLFHFSQALQHHVTHELGLPLIILLNKCDLVPSAALAAWINFFQHHFSATRVVPITALEKGGGRESAPALLEALMGCTITRHGQPCKVQRLVGLHHHTSWPAMQGTAACWVEILAG
jgi:ribosome biogenesis GTPase A